jgi:dTDP-4-amino-4,6-dideoxygalactose transaminase
MVVTADGERAERLRRLRAHGSKAKYYHKLIGGNFRLDALQAAFVSVKLKHLDVWTSARQHNARRYEKLFAETGLRVSQSFALGRHNAWSRGSDVGVPDLYLPTVVTNRHVFNQYVIRVADRNRIKAALDVAGVGTEIYYPVPLHLQECLAYLGHANGDFPESEGAAEETLALPIYPEVTEDQARYVVECIRDSLRHESGSHTERPELSIASSSGHFETDVRLSGFER